MSILPDNAWRIRVGNLLAPHFLAVVLFVCAADAVAAKHEVRTRGNQWIPVVLFVEPGDTVVWVGMEGHETALVEGMGPEDAMLWRSELGEEGFEVTFVLAGAYIYKCHVHLNAGMIGAIVVGGGDPPNIAEIDAAIPQLGDERPFVERTVARMKRALARR